MSAPAVFIKGAWVGVFSHWDIFPGKLLFGVCVWLPASFVLWMHMGYSPEFFFNAGWTFLFCLMIAEDFFCQTVDVRLAAGLFTLTAIYKLGYMAEGIEAFGWGCFAGFYISMLVFVIGIRVDETNQSECACNRGNDPEFFTMQIGFVPSIGLAIALWFFAADFVAGWEAAMLTMEKILLRQWIESAVLLSLIMGAVGIFQYCRFRKMCRKENRKALTVGFGEGDILVCLIVGGLLGWQSFLFVFFTALCGHVVVSMAFFSFGVLRAKLKNVALK